MAARLASIVITLDMEIIQAAQLSIDAHIVKESILQTPKIKLKEQVSDICHNHFVYKFFSIAFSNR